MRGAGVFVGGFWIQLTSPGGPAPGHHAPARPAHDMKRGAPGSAAELIRDEPDWLYQGWHGYLSTRRLRVWRAGPGHLVAMFSEGPADSGTSITNAAEAIGAQLGAEYPVDRVDIVEHWLEPPGFGGGRHYDAVTFPEGGPVWTPMPVSRLRSILGPTLGDDGDEDGDPGGRAGRAPDPDADRIDVGDGWSLFRVERDDPRIDPRFQAGGKG